MRVIDILSEAPVNKEKYIPAVNALLQRNGVNMPLEKKAGVYINFYPEPGQQVSDLTDLIIGKLDDGTVVSKTVKSLYKSKEIHNLLSGKAEDTKVINRGELAEGYHAAAAFARLIQRPLQAITVDDIKKIVGRLSNGKTLVLKKHEADNKIADEFHLTISLKPAQWEAFKDPETIARMGQILNSIVTDANTETARFAERFATNRRYDIVRVIGDGVSEETTRKTDVSFENQAEQKFAGFSLKVDNKQVHQVGGGAVTATLEQRFNILSHKLFGVDGKFPLADISGAKENFLKAPNIVEAQKVAYSSAVNSLNQNLQSDNQEKHFLQNLVNAMKYWIGRTDPNIKVKQFTNKGTLILDPQKIDGLIDNHQLDLQAVYTEGSSGLPKIIIKDTVSNKNLVSFRTKRDGDKYLRNYIEKEELWVELTVVKHIPNTPAAPEAPKRNTTQNNQKFNDKSYQYATALAASKGITDATKIHQIAAKTQELVSSGLNQQQIQRKLTASFPELKTQKTVAPERPTAPVTSQQLAPPVDDVEFSGE